jgi:hypothetical protein
MRLPAQLSDSTLLASETIHYKAFKALCILQMFYEAHQTGGFDPDDIAHHMGPDYFWKSKEVEAALNELVTAQAINEIEADFGSPWSYHYATN